MAKNNNTKKNEEAQLIFFPPESKKDRTMPNACIRSALFAIIKKGKRQILKGKKIFSQGDYTIYFSGEQLDQLDLDVFLGNKNMLAVEEMDKIYQLSMSEALDSCSLKRGKHTCSALKQSFKRLNFAMLEIQCKNGDFFLGHLLNGGAWQEDEETFHVRFDSKIMSLFSATQYTRIDIGQRRDVKTDLAKWLHAYWSSHNKILPIGVKRLQDLCGSKAQLKQFKQMLRKALAELERVGFLVAGSASVTRKGIVFATKAKKKLSQASKTAVLEGESIHTQAREPFIKNPPIINAVVETAKEKKEPCGRALSRQEAEVVGKFDSLRLSRSISFSFLDKYGEACCLLQIKNLQEQLNKDIEIKSREGWLKKALEKNFSAAGSWQSPHVSPAESEALGLMSGAGIDAASQENFLDLFGLEKCIEKMHALNEAIKNGTTISNKKSWLNDALEKKREEYEDEALVDIL